MLHSSRLTALAATVAATLAIPADRALAQTPGANPVHTLGGTLTFYSSAKMPKDKNTAAMAMTAADFDKYVCQSPFFEPPSTEKPSSDPFERLANIFAARLVETKAFQKDETVLRIIATCALNEPARVPFQETMESGIMKVATKAAYDQFEKLCEIADKAKPPQREAANEICNHSQAAHRDKLDAEDEARKEWDKLRYKALDRNFDYGFPQGLPISGSFVRFAFGWHGPD